MVVGHQLGRTLKALAVKHSFRRQRDTSLHPWFEAHRVGKTPALSTLCRAVLDIHLEGGFASPVGRPGVPRGFGMC